MQKLLIVFSLILIFTSVFVGQADPFSAVQEKMDGVSDEEKQVLGDLFKLMQEIEIIEREEKAIGQEAEKLNKDIEALETTIEAEEIEYNKKKDALKQVLKSYQRMGPSSYIEIILNSDSLSAFLRRINILRDLSRDTGKLLEQLETGRDKLLENKNILTESLSQLQHKQKQLSEALTRENQLKEDMEEYLASLEDKKKYYQDHLTDMHNAWDELKSVFSDTVEEFSHIIRESSLPADALKISFSVNGVKGSIDEKTFNDIISQQNNLERMEIDFQPDKIKIELTDKNLILIGRFVAQEGHILRFQAEEGVFFGMPLELESLEELFRENQLALDLGTLLGDNTLESVNIREDNLELMIKINLF